MSDTKINIVFEVEPPTDTSPGSAVVNYATPDPAADAAILRLCSEAALRAVTETTKRSKLLSASQFVMAEAERRGMGSVIGEAEQRLIAEFLIARDEQDEDEPAPTVEPRTRVRFVETSPHSGLPFDEMTLDQLKEEESYWDGIVNGTLLGSVSVGPATTFRHHARTWITRRERAAAAYEEAADGNIMADAFHKATAPEDEWINTKEVGDLTGINEKNLQNYMRTRGFPAPTKKDGRNYWMRGDVLRWMEKRVATLSEDTHPAAAPAIQRLADKLEDYRKGRRPDKAARPVAPPGSDPLITSDNLPEYVGIPNKTLIFYYKKTYGFPEADTKKGRVSAWRRSTLVKWMEQFVAKGRQKHFSNARFHEIADALARARAEDREEESPEAAPAEQSESLELNDTMHHILTFTRRMGLVRVGDTIHEQGDIAKLERAGYVQRVDRNGMLHISLTQAGLIRLESDKAKAEAQ